LDEVSSALVYSLVSCWILETIKGVYRDESAGSQYSFEQN
jgi:hypothetical protein